MISKELWKNGLRTNFMMTFQIYDLKAEPTTNIAYKILLHNFLPEKKYLERKYSILDVDRSAFLISKANELKQRLELENVEFFQGDFLDFAKNVPSQELDYIVAIDTIVSFDYRRPTHNHKEFSQVLSEINRVLKDEGRFFIIEAHPFFGQLAKGITFSNKGHFHGRLPNYKIEYKAEDNPHHWFTLDEMTSGLSENCLAICRIYEPDPSVELEKENAQLFKFFLKYPHMIVYEICKVNT
jgi:SAM-dependent methyltransferase